VFRLKDISLDPLFKWVKHKFKGSNQGTKDEDALKKILFVSFKDLYRKQRGKTIGLLSQGKV
jgi:hypothetical protein